MSPNYLHGSGAQIFVCRAEQMEETEGCKTRRSGSHVESKLLCPETKGTEQVLQQAVRYMHAPVPGTSRGAPGRGWAMCMGLATGLSGHVHLIT